MDLDSVADELYAASPDEFVERRKLRVDEARAVKDRQLVKAIGQLRRPTRSAWLVNVLARESPADIETLLDLGTALGQAQQRASGPDLRRLSKDRQSTLDTLTRRATELAAAHGHTATEATRQEVSQTLQAALADVDVAELVRTGRVVQPATYGGFGPTELFALSAPAEQAPELGDEKTERGKTERGESDAEETEPQATAAGEGDASPDHRAEQPTEDPRLAPAREAVDVATGALDAARRACDETEQEAAEATQHADEMADKVEALRAQLEAAVQEEREAQRLARAARKEHQVQQESVSAAERTVAEVQDALAGLEG